MKDSPKLSKRSSILWFPVFALIGVMLGLSGCMDASLRLEHSIKEAIAQAESGNTTSAINRLESLQDEHPNNADVAEALAIAYDAHGNYLLASNYYQKASRLSADKKHLLKLSAEGQIQAGRFDDAAGRLTNYLETFPEDGAMWLKLGELRYQLEDPEGAVEALTRGILLTDVSEQTGSEHEQLGLTFLELQDYAQADYYLNNALQLSNDPQVKGRALVGLVRSSVEQEDWDVADVFLNQLEVTQPDLLQTSETSALKASVENVLALRDDSGDVPEVELETPEESIPEQPNHEVVSDGEDGEVSLEREGEDNEVGSEIDVDGSDNAGTAVVDNVDTDDENVESDPVASSDGAENPEDGNVVVVENTESEQQEQTGESESDTDTDADTGENAPADIAGNNDNGIEVETASLASPGSALIAATTDLPGSSPSLNEDDTDHATEDVLPSSELELEPESEGLTSSEDPDSSLEPNSESAADMESISESDPENITEDPVASENSDLAEEDSGIESASESESFPELDPYVPPENEPELLLIQAQQAMAEGDTAVAIRMAWDSVNLRPKNPSGWFILSRGYSKYGQDLNAESAALEAMRLNPKNKKIVMNYLGILQRSRSANRFHDELVKTYQRFPQDPDFVLALARSYARIKNDPENAAALYRRFFDLAPDHDRAAEIRQEAEFVE